MSRQASDGRSCVGHMSSTRAENGVPWGSAEPRGTYPKIRAKSEEHTRPNAYLPISANIFGANSGTGVERPNLTRSAGTIRVYPVTGFARERGSLSGSRPTLVPRCAKHARPPLSDRLSSATGNELQIRTLTGRFLDTCHCIS